MLGERLATLTKTREISIVAPFLAISGVLVANTIQAKKRARQAEQHRHHNTALRSMLRTYIKKVIAAVESKDSAAAKLAYQEAVSVIDRSANKGLIHKNNAARHKSRLNTRVRGMQV